MEDMYTSILNSSAKRKMAERLAEIEAEDREVCSHCGGEDCVCCEIYQDRQKWENPVDFFSEERWGY